MNYIIDSDTIIDFINLGDINLFPPDVDKLVISVISYIEVLYGVKKPKSKKRLEDFLGFIKKNKIKIVPIEKSTANKFVSLKINLEKKGKRLDDFDLLIASTAITNDLTLVTRNKKHFSRIKGLKLY